MTAEPKDAHAWFFEGNAQMAAGEVAAAEECYRQALQLAPDFAEAYVNLGMLLEEIGEATEAEASYRCALSLNAGLFETHLNLGALLAGQKRFAEAESAYHAALHIDEHSPRAWSNLGVLYVCLHREAEAELCYSNAIGLDPDYTTARFNFSYLLLRQGRYEAGWQHLEARNWYAAQSAYFTCPRWQGEALAGKSILISFEAGHGDMIQFCRYAARLKAMGAARIDILCHPALQTLFASLVDVSQVLAFNGSIPSSGWDYWTPPLSMPYYCQTRLHSIPAALPYLYAQADKIAKWAACIPADGLRVGLVWKGNPDFENDADRSLPGLDTLLPLATLPGIALISLQKGAGESEALRPPAGFTLTHLGTDIQDFSDTAAIVASLDLVICVDTAVAHLAGAMAKRCWVLLPYYKTDWRWLVGRPDTPWYPGIMRLFRQPAMGDWSSVIADVKEQLEGLSFSPR